MPENLTQKQKDEASENINIASQGLPHPNEDATVENNLEKAANKPKADEHGVIKSAETGSTLSASAKVTTNQSSIAKPVATERFASPKPTPASANNPNPAAIKSPASSSVTQKASLGVISSRTELTGDMEVVIYLERSDGITLQLPMSFTNKQDLYGIKNMFDLLGKMINLSSDKLNEEFSSFVKYT